MELDIYTSNFAYLGCIDSFTSLRWRQQCFEAGELELHCRADDNNLYLAQKERFILRAGYNELAVIEGRRIEDAGRGDTIKATGRMGSAILDRAIIERTYNFNGRVEEAMRKLVAEQAPRVATNITLGALAGFTETITAQISYRNLLSTLLALSRASNILFRLRPDVDNKKLIFECYKGADKTTAQALRPYVVFSDIDDTLKAPIYEETVKTYRNFAYVAGDGEGVSRTVVTVNRVLPGEPRREVFVDAKDIQRGELTQQEYINQLLARGNQKLDEFPYIENFESATEQDVNYIYREDWEVGDIVTCHKSEWDIIIDSRITEAEEVYEQSGQRGTITPTFGSPLPEKFNTGGI